MLLRSWRPTERPITFDLHHSFATTLKVARGNSGIVAFSRTRGLVSSYSLIEVSTAIQTYFPLYAFFYPPPFFKALTF